MEELEIFRPKIWTFISNSNCLENDKSCNFHDKDTAKDFSAYFSNLAENLVSKLPNPSNKCGVLSVAQYCSHLELTKIFDLIPAEKDYLIKILRDIDTWNAAGIDRLPGRFLKDGANVLGKLVTDICSLWISLNKFPSSFKLAKLNLFSKRTEKLMSQITDQSPYSKYFRRSLKKLVTIKQLHF